MKKQELSYEITPKEKRSRNAKAFISFIKMIPILIVLGFIMAITQGDFDFSLTVQYLTFWGYLFLLIFVLLFINIIFPHKYRKYYMDSSGITIQKGRKNKKYFWDEFSSFFVYGVVYMNKEAKEEKDPEARRASEMLNKVQENSYKNYGQAFYLCKKNSGLGKIAKRFVLVYSEPDNSKEVEDFLSQNIKKREGTGNDFIGLTFYDFK